MKAVAIIGLGEVGSTIARALIRRGVPDLRCWDTKFADNSSCASQNAADLSLATASSCIEAIADAELIISAVTPAQALTAAESAAPAIKHGAWYLDVNSSSPDHKSLAATSIDQAGGRYVEAALMSPIYPKGLGASFLLGGPHASAFAEIAADIGLEDVTFFSEQVGEAAATKLCRSIIVKGLEALVAEALVTAHAYGVHQQVLASLGNVLPDTDWSTTSGYFLRRSLQHGKRRSEEMDEAAATVSHIALDPTMALATAHRQAWMARHAAITGTDGSTESLLSRLTDEIASQEQTP